MQALAFEWKPDFSNAINTTNQLVSLSDNEILFA